MKQNEIIVESIQTPQVGDGFFLEAGDLLIETEIISVDETGVVIRLDETAQLMLADRRQQLAESRMSLDPDIMRRQAEKSVRSASRAAKLITSGDREKTDRTKAAGKAFKLATTARDIEAQTANQSNTIKETDDRVSDREDYGTPAQRKKYIDKLSKSGKIDRSDCEHMTLPELKKLCSDPERVDENLRKWFKEKWVRFGPDGKIRGDCARGSESEGKPKCLPQSKAHSLGKSGRATAARRKRREDPDADRSGSAKNVRTKESREIFTESKKSINLWESLNCEMKLEDRMTIWEQLTIKGTLNDSSDEQHKLKFKSLFSMSEKPEKGKKYIIVPLALVNNKTLQLNPVITGRYVKEDNGQLTFMTSDGNKNFPSETIRDAALYNTWTFESVQQFEKFETALALYFDTWLTKKIPSVKLPENKKLDIQSLEPYILEGRCPHCLGEMVAEDQLTEGKKDACYHKVKSRVKIWPSAYASGQLVQCRKRGAANWGKKSTKESLVQEYNQEDIYEDDLGEAKYQGRTVPLGKPMKGDVKKSKVYVKNAKGNVVKVNFGDKNMRIKKSNPSRRKSFRARHNCANPGPRWKARYWSCKMW